MYQGQLYSAGAWHDAAGGARFTHRNPARLSEVTGEYADGTADDARAAIAAAAAAYPAWRALAPQARADHLKLALAAMIQRRDEIAAVLTAENGKTLAESRVEIDAAIRECDYQLAEGVRLVGQTVPVTIAGTLAYSRREPLGVAAIIAPWNFPFNVPVRKGIPALMAGNTVVFKPASLTPRTGLLLTELMIAAGLPAGVWNCVTGGGRAVGETLVTDPRVKAISFTGSTAVGRRIHELAARNFTRTQLELGGKNPTVVLEDADLEAAVAATVRAAFACAGQWCTSTSRAVVVAPIAEAFTSRLLEQVRALRVGPGEQPGTDMGPVCGEAQHRDILAYIAKGRAEGARLRCGGHALTGPGYDGGCFIAPTVFDQVTPAMTIAQEEIFGPVLAIQVVPDFAAAVAVANGVRYGLSSSIFTRDLGRALTFMEQTEAGLTHVNLLTSLKEPQLVFGGIKESGVGIPEAGHDGLTFFTEHKVAYVKYR